jgi:4-hydroxybenzoate polyprenyltransferase
MSPLRRLALYLPHLRLPFQLTLAPIFLWGALLSGGRWSWATSAAFIALHLFLYPAATAFNSAFDRDEGPIGGNERPPPVPPGLLRFSLLLGAIGALPAACAGAEFLLLYGAAAVWTVAYSHPATRWKASPWQSAGAIALGQGAVGFLAGWAAAAPLEPGAEALLAGAGGAALTALGLYPATQIFQVDEDRARGDRTLAVALGPASALRFGSACLALAGAAAVWLLVRRSGTAEAALVGIGYLALILWQERLARILPRLDRTGLYRGALRLLDAAATYAFLAFLAWQLAGR